MKLLSVWLLVLVSVHVISNNIITAAIEDEWWRSGVFYQIYPRSFMDSDESGEGDVRGIINRLEHLKELGVTGAWLNPIFVSPMADGGYDIADFTQIDPRYGSNEDLEELFAKAKELGIRILLDLVPNHTSDKHVWFNNSASSVRGFEDYYVWRNCSVRAINTTHYEINEYPNNWIAVFHTRAWTYHPIRQQCYLHQFLAAQPDLNYANPQVEAAMLNNLLFWLAKGVDGFRIDAINHMFETEGLPDEEYIDNDGDKTFYDNLYHNHTRDLDASYQVIFRWRQAMDEFAAGRGLERKFMMTEAYADIDLQIKWYGNATVPGSHMPFNFALISNLDRDSKAQDFQDAVDAWYSRLPSDIAAEANWVLGNHDRPRIGYRYGENRHESLVMMTMLLPGINVVYYGEEILMTDNREITWKETDDPAACQTNETVYQLYSRDPVRTPFQWDNTPFAGFTTGNHTWLPIHANYQERNLKAQMEADKSTFKFYKHMIQLRKSDIFRFGALRSKAINPDVFSYVRTAEGQDPVVVFINLSVNTTLSASSILTSDEIPQNARGRILAATSTSNYEIDDIIDINQIELSDYDGIAFVVEETAATPGSASATFVSLVLMIASVFVILL